MPRNLKTLKRQGLPATCLKCMAKCNEPSDVTSCIAYEYEKYHWHRMIDGDCPLIDEFIDNIFFNIVDLVKEEFNKTKRGK